MPVEKKNTKANNKIRYPFKKLKFLESDDKPNPDAIFWYQWEPFKFINKDALIVIEPTENGLWEIIFLQNDNDCDGINIGKPSKNLKFQMKTAVEYVSKLMKKEMKGFEKYEKLL